MIWPNRLGLINRLDQALQNYSANTRNLPGIESTEAREALVLQIVASLRRLDYTNALRSRPVAQIRADPASDLFDPERAALWYASQGNIDEAAWLLFLSIHFGKHGKSGWRRLRDVYSGLGEGRWTWERVSSEPASFRDWLRRRAIDIRGAFGNHRKYESLGSDNAAGTAAVVQSYLNWVGPERSHQQRFADLIREGGNDPNSIFDAFYRSFNVARFGRLGRFDFLAMLGRLGLAPMAPGSAYLDSATGPLRGAKLLFCNRTDARFPAATLDAYLIALDLVLNVGMQVLEDSLCNWQKSPRKFIHFRG